MSGILNLEELKNDIKGSYHRLLNWIFDEINILEIDLTDFKYSPTSLQLELPTLYQTIKLLMDETFATKDRQLKPLLAYFELRARICKDYIEGKVVSMN